jgi:hypothetical protein
LPERNSSDRSWLCRFWAWALFDLTDHVPAVVFVKKDSTEPKLVLPREPQSFSFEEFARQAYSARGQKSNLSSQQINRLFRDTAKEMDFELNSLRVAETLHKLAAVNFDEKMDVLLFPQSSTNLYGGIRTE